MSKDEIHKKFTSEDIYGIDVMHFAAHMTATNLSSQNIRVYIEPNVFSRDGVEALVQPLKTEYDLPIMEQTLDKWLETMTGTGIPDDFDIVIMNPPFTRRERIPDKISKLCKLVPEVKGKTGYWAYFVIPADKVLKQNGILAVVIPEEFFVGASAESVRNYLFERGYSIQFVVRSSVEVAFSEAALYRDYLVVLKKGATKDQLVVAILKKKLQDIKDKISDLAIKIKEFSSSPDSGLNSEELEAVKIFNATNLIKKHIKNLKPLVAFNTIKAHKVALELLDELKDRPTLEELGKKGLVRMRTYNPGQYKTRGVENYARRLYTSRYGSKSPNVVFLSDKVYNGNVNLSIKKTKTRLKLPFSAILPSLRTYSGVKHINLTNEEEFVVVDSKTIPIEIIKLAGLAPQNKLEMAMNDIKIAYNDIASNVLLVRRVQLTSPGLYWLAFYSDKRMISNAVLINMQVKDIAFAKILTLYLSSTIALLQLLSFVAETRGAWVDLHSGQEWGQIHVPAFNNLSEVKVKKAMALFQSVGKLDVKTMYQRIKEHDKTQKQIDEMALEMVGLDSWKSRLDELYEAVAEELETMHKILETSRKMSASRRK